MDNPTVYMTLALLLMLAQLFETTDQRLESHRDRDESMKCQLKFPRGPSVLFATVPCFQDEKGRTNATKRCTDLHETVDHGRWEGAPCVFSIYDDDKAREDATVSTLNVCVRTSSSSSSLIGCEQSGMVTYRIASHQTKLTLSCFPLLIIPFWIGSHIFFTPFCSSAISLRASTSTVMQ